MYSAIQAAVAAEHVRDMLSRAAQDGRARQARHARRAGRARAARRARRAPQARLVGGIGPGRPATPGRSPATAPVPDASHVAGHR
ncbi:MAG: hypothetical protein ACHP9Z_02940 [Streptosporangiales bacterium]